MPNTFNQPISIAIPIGSTSVTRLLGSGTSSIAGGLTVATNLTVGNNTVSPAFSVSGAGIASSIVNSASATSQTSLTLQNTLNGTTGYIGLDGSGLQAITQDALTLFVNNAKPIQLLTSATVQTNAPIVMTNVSLAPPSFTTRSVGTKLVLFAGVTSTTAEYALGIDANVFWNSVPSTTGSFTWYGGTTLAATLTGTGNFNVQGAVNIGSTLSATGASSFSSTVSIGGASTSYGRLAILGNDTSSTGGPHITSYTSADTTYPVSQWFNWTHNNIALVFDAYFNTSWISSFAGSSAQIYKIGNVLNFNWGVAAVGSALSWSTALQISLTTGAVIASGPSLTVSGTLGTAGAASIGTTLTVGSTSANPFVITPNSRAGVTTAQYVTLDIAGNGTLYVWDNLESSGSFVAGGAISAPSANISGNLTASSATISGALVASSLYSNPATSGGPANGFGVCINAKTYTDNVTAASGTAGYSFANYIYAPTISAQNTSVTTSNAATLLIAGPPLAGTNMTITNPYALYVAGGLVGIFSNAASTSPTTGALMVTGGVGIGGAVNLGSTLTGTSAAFTGVVTVQSTLDTSSSSCALQVAGGTNIAKTLYVGGTADSIFATTGALQVAGGVTVAKSLSVGSNSMYVSGSTVYPPGPLTANTTTLSGYSYGNGTYTATSDTPSGAFYAFDGPSGGFFEQPNTYNTNTGAYTGSTTTNGYAGGYIQITLPGAITIASFTLIGRGGFETLRSPRDFQVFGSNDTGVTWISILTSTGNTNWVAGTAKSFTVNASTAYSSYRLVANTIGNFTSGSFNEQCLDVGEWSLLGSAVVMVNPTSDSSSTTTGALQVAGGVGIAKSLFVGGNITEPNAYYGTFTLSGSIPATTPTNITVAKTAGNLALSGTTGVTLPVTGTYIISANFNCIFVTEAIIYVNDIGTGNRLVDVYNGGPALPAARHSYCVTAFLTAGTVVGLNVTCSSAQTLDTQFQRGLAISLISRTA